MVGDSCWRIAFRSASMWLVFIDLWKEGGGCDFLGEHRIVNASQRSLA